MFSNNFYENRDLYEIMLTNTAEPGRPQMTIWRMRIACWIPKATNTLSEYVIPIEFSPQQQLQERVSKLRYAYIAYLSIWPGFFNSCRRLPETKRHSSLFLH